MYEYKVGDTGRSRCGKKYRVICTDRRTDTGKFCVIALLKEDSGHESIETYSADGRWDIHNQDTHFDLLQPLLPITPGKYRCEDGSEATVCGILPEPSSDNYPVLGWVIVDGISSFMAWSVEGRVCRYAEHEYDLVESVDTAE